MKQWWERSDVSLEADEKNQVEDYTGCIPLLLRNCKDGNKINLCVASTKDVWNKASMFVWDIHMEKPHLWERYNILIGKIN
jgi:hypothetical protein